MAKTARKKSAKTGETMPAEKRRPKSIGRNLVAEDFRRRPKNIAEDMQTFWPNHRMIDAGLSDLRSRIPVEDLSDEEAESLLAKIYLAMHKERRIRARVHRLAVSTALPERALSYKRDE